MIKDLINFCWFIFKWGVVPGTIIALAAIVYLHRQLDEEIRCQIESRFAKHYTDFNVTVRDAVRVEGEGIEIRDFSIAPRGAKGSDSAVLHVEQAFLRCTTDLADLIGDEVRVCHATVRRPTIRLIRLPDGTWSGSRLWPPPKFGHAPPDMTIENGTIEIVDMTRNPRSTLTLRNVNLSIENQPADKNDPNGKAARVLQGTLQGDHIGHIEIRGVGDPETLEWRLTGTARDLKLSPEFHEALPAPLAAQLVGLVGFRGRINLEFDVQSDATAPHGCRFAVQGKIAEGRFDDRRLPDQFRNIRGSIRANNTGFAVENLFAEIGRSTVWIAHGESGFGAHAPWSIKGKVTQFKLDPRLRASLPADLQARWDKYQPLGQVDAEVELKSDGRKLDMTASKARVDLNKVAFTYHRFPYTLESGQGELVLEKNVLSFKLTAQAGPSSMQMKGAINDPLGAPYGRFEAFGKDLAVDSSDEKLLRALSALNRATTTTVRKLAPRGLCDFHIWTWRDKPDGELFRKFQLDLKNATICFDHFPYPIRKIHGRIERFADGHWEYNELKGVNDTARIVCSGNLTQTPRGKRLSLVLRADNVLLEDKELRGALKPSMQQAWDNLGPRGMIDLETDIKWTVGDKKPHLVITARPHRDNASIKPRVFPYHMEKLEGTIVYRDGHVRFDRFVAWHGRTRLSGRGYWNFLPDGRWDFHLADISVDRLSPDDRALKLALPGPLREGLAKINAGGFMSLHKSALNVYHTAVAGEPMRMDWDVRLGLLQARIDCGIRLENIHGKLRMRGAVHGRDYTSVGRLNLDSLTFKNLQFTDVKGPIRLDNGRVLLGSYVAQAARKPDGTFPTPPRPVSAKLFGGKFTTNTWIAPKHNPCYFMQADLTGADLAQFAKQTMPGKQDLKGRVGCRLTLRGRAPTMNGLEGHGQMWLREGDVYQLPLMVSILKILKLQEPSTSAFSDADVQFTLSGKHIQLKPIIFRGDAISLTGQGTMELPSKIDLAFYAVFGNNRWYVPLVSPVAEAVSSETMTVRIRGSLQDPRTSRDVLPGVKQALRDLERSLQTPIRAPVRPAMGRQQRTTRKPSVSP